MKLKFAPLVLALALTGPATPQTLSQGPLGPPPADKVQIPLTTVGWAALSADGYSVDYSWPLSGAEAWFRGPEVTFRISDTPGRLSVKVDGNPVADLGHPGAATITLRDLPPAAGDTHHIEIVKYNESLGETGHVLGLYAEAAAAPVLPGVAPSAGQMEVIGDSWTAGYGNLGKTPFCSSRKISDSTDARLTWGPFVAEALGLKLRMTAFSGVGMVRNYDGAMPSNTMPALYGRATFGDGRRVNYAGWQPRLIIIALGGNDFDRPLHYGEAWEDEAALREDFVKVYVDFVRRLRQLNPHAGLVLMDYGNGEVTGAIRRVAAQVNAEGDVRVATYVAAGPFERHGCDLHPNVSSYRRIATGLTAWLRQHPDLWDGQA